MNKLGRTLDITTKYKTSFLIDKLKEHHDHHVNDYAKAVKVYQSDLARSLEKLSIAASGNDLEEVKQTFNKVFAIVKPVDARKAYEQYISLLSNSADEVIELHVDDANSIINDEWDWAVQAKTTNSFYSSRS